MAQCKRCGKDTEDPKTKGCTGQYINFEDGTSLERPLMQRVNRKDVRCVQSNAEASITKTAIWRDVPNAGRE